MEALQDHITDAVLPNEQFGFRESYSAYHQVAEVGTDTVNAFNSRRNHTALLLVDLEKAFDRVWTAGLLHKMIVLRLPPALMRIIHSYLQGRTYRVRVKESLSASAHIPTGMPQRSLLGPILFNIYTSDIPRFLNYKIAIYADDTLIYTHGYFQPVALAKLQNYITY